MLLAPPTQSMNVIKSPSRLSTISILTTSTQVVMPPCKKTQLTSTQAQQKHANKMSIKITIKTRGQQDYILMIHKKQDKKISVRNVSELVEGKFQVKFM